MTELEAYRGQIDAIDAQLVALFCRRMDVTQAVGRYKQAHGLPVLDLQREREVLAAKSALVADSGRRADVAALFQAIMGLSRQQQRLLVQEGPENPGYTAFLAALAAVRLPVAQPRVVYQGVPGAYSEEAAVGFFGPDAACQGMEQFEDVFRALADGQADYGVLPVENSSTGSIRQVYDLLARYGCYLVGEEMVQVEHCLMALPGATLADVTHVHSHEQGLLQSSRFLEAHPTWQQVPMLDTAGSGKYVAALGDIHHAAICSRRAAGLYGLEILAQQVNSNTDNVTRFMVVSPRLELRPGRNIISAVFTLPHQSGSLHELLTHFAAHGLNMVKLESRPIPGKSWEYHFFLEFTGDLTADGMGGILRELSQLSTDVRILGNFKAYEG